jgi:AAA domain
MSLRTVAERHVFASVTDVEDLVRMYVPSGELAGTRGDERPETKIYRALTEQGPPQRLHVYGEAGAGKTSLILRALADIAKRTTLQRPPHPLFVNTGDAPSALEEPQHLMRMILGLIRVNSYAFASVDPNRLAAAAADQTTYTPRTVTHQASITTPVFAYQASLQEAFKSLTFEHDAASVRADFEDVLRQVARDYRPLIIIDDTDHFAHSGPSGQLNETAIANLYNNGARTLAEFQQLDLIVAIQPRFREVAPVTEVERRFNFQRVDVTKLPSGSDDLALARVLERRLKAAGIDAQVDELIEPLALAELQAAYFLVDCDLRRVLEFADAAAQRAAGEDGQRIAPRHVQQILDEHAPGAREADGS